MRRGRSGIEVTPILAATKQKSASIDFLGGWPGGGNGGENKREKRW